MPRPSHDLALAARIGAVARARRAELDRTLLAVSSAAGISESMLSKVEHGLALPSVTTPARLAAALGIKPGALFPAPTRRAA